MTAWRMCETATAIVKSFGLIRRETEVAEESVVLAGAPPT